MKGVNAPLYELPLKSIDFNIEPLDTNLVKVNKFLLR